MSTPLHALIALAIYIFAVGMVLLFLVKRAPYMEEPADDLPQRHSTAQPLTDDEIIALYEGRDIHGGVSK